MTANVYQEQDLYRMLPMRAVGTNGDYVIDEVAVGGHLQERIDIGTTEIYQGTAARGAVESDAVWTIKRVQLDAEGDPSTVQWADTAAWTNRTSEVYS